MPRLKTPKSMTPVAAATLRQAVGERLKEARFYRDMDQQDVCHFSGVSRVMISDFERGTRTPNIEHLEAIASALQIRQAWLFTGEGSIDHVDPTRQDLHQMALKFRRMDVDLIAACCGVLRRIPSKKSVWELAIGSFTGVYVVTGGLIDAWDAAWILEGIANKYGLNLIAILEAVGDLNVTIQLSRMFMGTGIDPEAFQCRWEGGESILRYEAEKARPRITLQEESARYFAVTPNPAMTTALDYLGRHVRPIDP